MYIVSIARADARHVKLPQTCLNCGRSEVRLYPVTELPIWSKGIFLRLWHWLQGLAGQRALPKDHDLLPAGLAALFCSSCVRQAKRGEWLLVVASVAVLAVIAAQMATGGQQAAMMPVNLLGATAITYLWFGGPSWGFVIESRLKGFDFWFKRKKTAKEFCHINGIEP